MNWTAEQIEQAQLTKRHFPYRRVWLVLENGEFYVLAKPTAATANSLARKGHHVAELTAN